MYKHFPHIMYYILVLMIVTSCTSAQRCADSFITNTYNRTTYRVSDEDFDTLFTDASLTRSKIHCLSLCSTYRTNSYYDRSSRQCRCEGWFASYSPVSSGTNYVEKYSITGMSLNISSNMSSLSFF